MLNKIFNIFKNKYTVLILNSKWEVLEKNVKIKFLPRTKDYIWSGKKYYQVTHIVHNLSLKQQISLIVEEIENIEGVENQ